MRLPNMFGLLTASALLIGASSANALELTIDDVATGGIEVTRTSTTGAVGYSTTLGDPTIGNFNVVVSSGFGQPFPGADPNTAQTSLSIQVGGAPNAAQTAAGDPAKMIITLTDPGLTLVTPPNGDATLESNFSVNDNTAGAIATIETFIRTASSGVFESLSTLTGGPNTNLVEAVRSVITSGEEFDLRTVITVEIDKSGFASAAAGLVVAPVPVPAALPLFLTALLGLGFIGRQRRRQAA